MTLDPTPNADTLPVEELWRPNSPDYMETRGEQCLALHDKGRLVFYPPWQAWLMTHQEDIMDCWQKEYLSSDFYDWEFAHKRLEKDEWQNFEKAMIGHSLLADQDHHRFVRKIVSPAFSRNVVDDIQDKIKPDIDALFDKQEGKEEFDYNREIAANIPFISITRMIGLPEKYWEEFKPVVINFTKTWNPTISDEEREKARQECNRAIDIIKEVVAERRKQPQKDDFLSVMLKIEEENENFDEWDIITMTLALIGAGSETTMNAQQWSVYGLLKFPEQVELALASEESFANAFSEFHRWSLVNKMGFARYAPKDMEILGEQVRKGQMVLLMPQLRYHDKNLYENPEVLDVTRTFDPQITFGYGPRYCIGAALAKRQLQTSIAELFKRFPKAELAREPEIIANAHNGIALRKLIIKTNI